MSKELQCLIIKIDKSHWETKQEKEQINNCIDIIKERENKLEKLESYLIKWNDLLSIDGINSKSMVKNDIQYLLKEKEEQQKHGQ